jgi:hypothetical protein
MSTDLSDAKRAASFFLTRSGLTLSDAYTLNSLDEESNAKIQGFTETERFQAWLAESLLTGCRAFERGDVRIAFRCFAQCREYAGRLHGFPGPSVADGVRSLEQAIERLLPGRS